MPQTDFADLYDVVAKTVAALTPGQRNWLRSGFDPASIAIAMHTGCTGNVNASGTCPVCGFSEPVVHRLVIAALNAQMWGDTGFPPEPMGPDRTSRFATSMWTMVE